MNLSTFDRLVSESDFTKSEVEAVAAIFSSRSEITESMVEAVESFYRKHRVVLRKIHLIELFNRGRERFGEITPCVAAAIGAIPDPERIEELLVRVRNYESWEELLASLRPPANSTTDIGDNP